jgi:hypothetical protein
MLLSYNVWFLLSSRVDNFKRASGTFEISRLLSNAPQAHTHISARSRPPACRRRQIRIVFSELGFAELDVSKC